MQMPVDTNAVLNVLEGTLDGPADAEMRISSDPDVPARESSIPPT